MRICPYCLEHGHGEQLLKVERTKSPNSQYLYLLRCQRKKPTRCPFLVSGKSFKDNALNPRYFSEISTKTRDVKLKELGYTSYKDYLFSEHWWSVKKRYKTSCFVCGSKRTHLHHRTYKNFGKERRKDLISLCKKHHWDAHKSKPKRYSKRYPKKKEDTKRLIELNVITINKKRKLKGFVFKDGEMQYIK